MIIEKRRADIEERVSHLWCIAMLYINHWKYFYCRFIREHLNQVKCCSTKQCKSNIRYLYCNYYWDHYPQYNRFTRHIYAGDNVFIEVYFAGRDCLARFTA